MLNMWPESKHMFYNQTLKDETSNCSRTSHLINLKEEIKRDTEKWEWARYSEHLVYSFGDICTTPVKAIIHQVNCLAIRSHGLSKYIAHKFPWADIYKTRRGVGGRNLAIPEDRGTPGTVKILRSPNGRSPDVVCFLSQWDMGRTAQYRKIQPYEDLPLEREFWFKQCLNELSKEDYESIAFPCYPDVNHG